jgi:hypothetical protein
MAPVVARSYEDGVGSVHPQALGLKSTIDGLQERISRRPSPCDPAGLRQLRLGSVGEIKGPSSTQSPRKFSKANRIYPLFSETQSLR